MKECPFCRCQAVPRFELKHTNVWECVARECGLMFAHPQLDDRNLALAYAKHYYPANGNGDSEVYENTPGDIIRQTFSKAEAQLGPLAKKHLLDFGSGVGGLCQIAACYGIHTAGIEPDANARRRASELTGTTIYESLDALHVAKPEAKFDMITIWDVVEHLREPWKVLKRLSAVLHPGGWLLLSTPNAASLRARIQKQRWENTTNPTHFYYFTRTSLKAVLRQAGFPEISELRFPIRYPGHAILRRAVNAALVGCRLQGQLLFVARPECLR